MPLANDTRSCPRKVDHTQNLALADIVLPSVDLELLGAKYDDRRNFELGLLTDDERLLDAAQDLFDRIWRGVECAGCRVREECPMPLEALEKAALEGRAPARVHVRLRARGT